MKCQIFCAKFRNNSQKKETNEYWNICMRYVYLLVHILLFKYAVIYSVIFCILFHCIFHIVWLYYWWENIHMIVCLSVYPFYGFENFFFVFFNFKCKLLYVHTNMFIYGKGVWRLKFSVIKTFLNMHETVDFNKQLIYSYWFLLFYFLHFFI